VVVDKEDLHNTFRGKVERKRQERVHLSGSAQTTMTGGTSIALPATQDSIGVGRPGREATLRELIAQSHCGCQK
jgi:hypothetical protein